ncbi:recombinase family protein [Serratia ureilytica]|uniref:recombinase family protein n=1 Tax=Serratia ureilytica TaxID=300181 RepID=UPI001FB6E8B9|nr:recombinase family protein [Serratia ureilytica]
MQYKIKWQKEITIILVGYARVSTQEQDTQAQISALKSAGWELFSQEKTSGRQLARPELQQLLQQLRKGDHVIVWKQDRFP